MDHSVDEYQYVCDISNIPVSGHRVLVIQPEMKIKTEKSSVQLKLEETCALIKTLPCWHVVGKTTARTVSHGCLFPDHTLTHLTSLVTSNSDNSAVVIGVDMLTPVQLNTLQTLWGVPVFDRYTVVLQILKDHARTYEAKLQVAMAEIPHLRCRLPGVTEQPKLRLTGGGTRDAWLRNSQRLLQERELKLRTALRQVKNQRSLVRKKRQKKNIPTVAVVGYTNSGKTSLIEALTGDRKLEPRDQLFATLDVTAHAGTLPNMMSVLFIDTVGFIADIPVMLMEAFAATLEDAVLADLVLHVCDMSHPDCWRQRDTVLKALRPMLLDHQIESIIEVWNKVDIACDNSDGRHGLLVSTATGQNLDVLKGRLQTQLLTATKLLEKTFRLPMSASQHLSWLYKNATVTEAHPDTDVNYILVDVVITEAAYGKFKAMFVKK
ncbi:putative GTP-binding protein 6 isoform X2 [Haliotis asinina]